MSESVNVVCVRCDAVNRVPRDKLGARGKCGKCHEPLFSGKPAALHERNFGKHLARSGIPLLVDFWAAWCGPCKVMAPVIEQAARELEPDLRVAKVDTEGSPRLAAGHGIRSIPTVIMFKHGREAARISGALDLQSLLSWARQHI